MDTFVFAPPAAAVVPEPSVIALAVIAAVAILVRQIRRLRRPQAARLR